MSSANEEVLVAESKPVDLRLIVNVLSYAGSSIRRHRNLVLVLSAIIFGATVASLYLLPKSYYVEAKIYAQRNPTLALKGDAQPEGPAQSAAETILRRDNLISLVHKTDLLHVWYAHRAPLMHLKDVIVKATRKPEPEQDTTEWMSDVIAKQLKVFSPGEGVIQMQIEWPDPETALKLIEAVVQNYLDARRAAEVTAIEEQVAILQTHAAALRKDIDVSVDGIDRLRAKRLAAPAASSAPSPSASAAPTGSASPAPPRAPLALGPRPAGMHAEATRLKALIDAKQKAIGDLEEFRRRRLAELNAMLAEKSATYTENHPVIIDLRQTIASFSGDSPELEAARADVARLQMQLDVTMAAGDDSGGLGLPVSVGGHGGAPPLPGSIIRIEQESADDRDPEMMYARTRLRDAMEKYAQMGTTIESAQIDLDTAQAAFKYRYTVMEPPLYPKGPSKPKAPLVILGGLVGALLVSLLAAVGADLRRGRYLASWQVERSLDLPMLAEMDVNALAEHKLAD
jgi:uncharacterized protein involved in exopolysaccharide biosynthesis